MQVLCKASNTSSDVRCTVCGQGFLVYFWNSSLQARKEVKAQVQQTLRKHHHTLDSHAAHPVQGFNVPEWSGEAIFAADTLNAAAPGLGTALDLNDFLARKHLRYKLAPRQAGSDYNRRAVVSRSNACRRCEGERFHL